MKILESYTRIAKQLLIEGDDDKYVSIGFGRFKLKGKEDDDDADVYVKSDKGEYVKTKDQSSDDKDSSGQEKPDEPKGKALGGSDFDRDFDDEPTDKGDDKPSDKGEDNLKGVPSQFPEFELAEEPFDHDDYDEDMENKIADEVVSYFVDNADKEAMKDYTPEEMQDFVQAQSEKLVAKYQQPDGVPNEKRSMLAYRNDLIDNIRSELGYEDGEAGFDADDDLKSQKESIKVINGKKYKALGEK